MKNQTVKLLTVILAAVLFSACASKQIAGSAALEEKAKQLVKTTKLTPQEAFIEANEAIKTATQEELQFFAPLHMEQAREGLALAQKLLKKKGKEKETIQQSFKVKQLVDNGIQIKQQVNSLLALSLKQLLTLNEVGSPKILPGDYQDVYEDMIDLIKDIERGSTDVAIKNQADLLKDMTALEIETVRVKYMVPVETMLERAEDSDAQKLAEKTFEHAEKEIETAHKFIDTHYRDHQAVEKTSQAAMRAAKHAYIVATEVPALEGMKPEQAEQRILFVESLLERIARNLDTVELMGNSLHDQSVMIADQVEKLRDEIQRLHKELDTAKTTTSIETQPEVIRTETHSSEPVRSSDPGAYFSDVYNPFTHPPEEDNPESIPVESQEPAVTEDLPVEQGPADTTPTNPSEDSDTLPVNSTGSNTNSDQPTNDKTPDEPVTTPENTPTTEENPDGDDNVQIESQKPPQGNIDKETSETDNSPASLESTTSQADTASESVEPAVATSTDSPADTADSKTINTDTVTSAPSQ